MANYVSYSKLNPVRWDQLTKFKLEPVRAMFFCFLWTKHERFADELKKNGGVFYTYEQIKDELNISRVKADTVIKFFNEIGVLNKSVSTIKIGKYVTRKQVFAFNMRSLTNPEILSEIFKYEFVDEFQSEFAALAQKIGYFEPIAATAKPVDKMEVTKFYDEQLLKNEGQQYFEEYQDFIGYLTTNNNPFHRPINEILSMPGQPTYEEFEEIRKNARKKGVDLYKVLAKYIDKSPKSKSFTVSFNKWVESEREGDKHLGRINSADDIIEKAFRKIAPYRD